jgi:uncharacterized damage-inducible protein DinB
VFHIQGKEAVISQRAIHYISNLKRHEGVLEAQLEDLSEADLLLQPQPRGNCANWILGHITNSRSGMLRALNIEPIWGEEERAIYGRGSEPITSADSTHLSMKKLLEDFKAAGQGVIDCLETISDERLDEPHNENTSIAEWINFLVWHEAYHIGQFEYLRQLAGKDDKVI